MDEEKIIKKFNSLQQKYNLPEFKELNEEFEIEQIDDTSFLLREIRKRIEERISHFVKVVDDIIQPDTNNIANLHEYKFFNDKEREKILGIYQKMMKLDRQALLLNLNDKEENEAEFIKRSCAEWKIIKEEIDKIIRKLIQAWDHDLEEKDKQEGYFG